MPTTCTAEEMTGMKMKILILLLTFVIFIPGKNEVQSKRISMKIVDEPSSFGFNNQYQDPIQTPSIAMRVQPSNFSGPPHLRALYGKCFTKIDDSYKYEFCPFSNVTQHEQSLRWNPYSGVLGVWQEWEIENNTFTAMAMREGDSCGQVHRTIRIVMKCGGTNEIDKVTEPSTCNYLMTFKTPYVCHPHAMLVYPTLTSEARLKWDKLEGELAEELITKQGYDKRLHRIFEEAGYVFHEHKREEISKQAVHNEEQKRQKEDGDFESLDKCTEEYKKLKEEISGLRTLLAMHQGHTNDTHKYHHVQGKHHNIEYQDPADYYEKDHYGEY